MRNFFHSISFRFWIPFAMLPVVIFAIIAYYYPAQQKKILVDRKKEALLEAAQTIALGVELSMDFEDLNGVKKAIDFTKENRDFKFVGVVLLDSLNKTEELLATYPEGISYKEVSEVNTSIYLYKDFPFESKIAKGYIRVAEDYSKIEKEIEKINKPVYLFLIIAFPLFLLLLLFISFSVTKPILTLTSLVQKAKEQLLKDFSIPYSKGKSEIGVLQNTFAGLVESLREKNKENEAIKNNLELLVKGRTLELEEAKEKLILSQKRAKLGHYEVFLSTGAWECSETLAFILGIPDTYEKNRSGMENLIVSEFRHLVLPYFNKNNQDVSLEKEIQVYHYSSGNPFWVRIIGEKKLDKNGIAVSVTGIIQNITEQKIYQEEIKRLSYVASYTSNCVIIADKDKKIVWANESLLTLTGYRFDEIIGKTPAMFQFEKTDRNTIAYINSKLDKKEVISKVEILNRGKNGNEYWLELNIVPLLDEHKEITGYIAVENDITLRKQYEEGLRSINRDLEKRVQESVKANMRLSRTVNDYEKMASIGEMAAGVAHDLNTPISTIMVGGETLQYVLKKIFEEDIPNTTAKEWETIRKLVSDIKTESFVTGSQLRKEKSDLINYLKDVHRYSKENLVSIAELMAKCRLLPETQSDHIHLVLGFENPEKILRMVEQLQTVDTIIKTMNASVDKSTNVIKNLRSYIKNEAEVQKKSIQLYQNISSVLNIFNYDLLQSYNIKISIQESLFIYGNEIKLFQLWSNLIKNAIEALRDQEDKQIHIYAERVNEQVLICFDNNGPVIPEENINKIFKAFFSTKEKQGGSGLGLSIVKRIVQEHNGTLKVSSIPGKTSFQIILPQETAGF